MSRPSSKIRVLFYPVATRELQSVFVHPVVTKVLGGTGAGVPELKAHLAGEQVVYHVLLSQKGLGILRYTARVHYRDRHGEHLSTRDFPLHLFQGKFQAMFTLPKASPKYHAMLVLEPYYGPDK